MSRNLLANLAHRFGRHCAPARRAVPELDRRQLPELLHGMKPCALVFAHLSRCQELHLLNKLSVSGPSPRMAGARTVAASARSTRTECALVHSGLRREAWPNGLAPVQTRTTAPGRTLHTRNMRRTHARCATVHLLPRPVGTGGNPCVTVDGCLG